MDFYGFLQKSMWIHVEFLWIPTDSYGILMDSCGLLWILKDFHGINGEPPALWIPVDSCVFLCSPMDSYEFL